MKIEDSFSTLRFHHAGDSDAEDEADDANEGLVVPVDDSDNEDRQREQQKRRNYDLLLKRRQSARNRAKRGGSGEDVEDMLFEQVRLEPLTKSGSGGD